MSKKIAILSLDGGGIRGIIPSVILTYLESRLQKLDNSDLKIGDYFDFVAGTVLNSIQDCFRLSWQSISLAETIFTINNAL